MKAWGPTCALPTVCWRLPEQVCASCDSCSQVDAWSEQEACNVAAQAGCGSVCTFESAGSCAARRAGQGLPSVATARLKYTLVVPAGMARPVRLISVSISSSVTPWVPPGPLELSWAWSGVRRGACQRWTASPRTVQPTQGRHTLWQGQSAVQPPRPALGGPACPPRSAPPHARTCVHDTMGRLLPAWRGASHLTWYSSPVAIWWYTYTVRDSPAGQSAGWVHVAAGADGRSCHGWAAELRRAAAGRRLHGAASRWAGWVGWLFKQRHAHKHEAPNPFPPGAAALPTHQSLGLPVS